jgi:hypothetical protein
MPLYRRRHATQQIAKLNATSIDGYFGEVDGEYRTLQLQRPGNTIDIEDYDGEWATVRIVTRKGNRLGDNLEARVRLREADLRAVGVDVARILAGFGAFEAPAEPEEPEPLPEPVAAAVAAEPAVAPLPPIPAGSLNCHANGNGRPKQFQPTIELLVEPEAAPPEPVPVATVATAPVAETVVVDRVAASEPAEPKERVLFANSNAALVDGKLILEIGASVVAVALPVVLYFVRSLFAKKDDR